MKSLSHTKNTFKLCTWFIVFCPWTLFSHLNGNPVIAHHPNCPAKIRCYLIHPLYVSLPVSNVPVLLTPTYWWVLFGTHQYIYVPPCWRTWQYHTTFIWVSVSLWNDLGDTVFDGVRLECFFYWPKLLFLLFSLSLLSIYGLVLWC